MVSLRGRGGCQGRAYVGGVLVDCGRSVREYDCSTSRRKSETYIVGRGQRFHRHRQRRRRPTWGRVRRGCLRRGSCLAFAEGGLGVYHVWLTTETESEDLRYETSAFTNDQLRAPPYCSLRPQASKEREREGYSQACSSRQSCRRSCRRCTLASVGPRPVVRHGTPWGAWTRRRIGDQFEQRRGTCWCVCWGLGSERARLVRRGNVVQE
jgi:hypothetical protein